MDNSGALQRKKGTMHPDQREGEDLQDYGCSYAATVNRDHACRRICQNDYSRLRRTRLELSYCR